MTEKNGLDSKKNIHRKKQNDKEGMALAQSGSSNVAVKNTLNMKCCASSSNRMAQNIVNVTAATLQWSRAR